LPGVVRRFVSTPLFNMQTLSCSEPAGRTIWTHLKLWAVPALYFSLAVAANAQSAADFGTVQAGAKAVVNLIRLIGGVVGVGALVFATFRLYGGDMVRGLMGVFGGILGLLIAANAQSIVNGFYSTTG
jgi:hypothetical protein